MQSPAVPQQYNSSTPAPAQTNFYGQQSHVAPTYPQPPEIGGYDNSVAPPYGQPPAAMGHNVPTPNTFVPQHYSSVPPSQEPVPNSSSFYGQVPQQWTNPGAFQPPQSTGYTNSVHTSSFTPPQPQSQTSAARPVPSLPSRSSPGAAQQPEIPSKKPLPDPMSFPKPPPFMGREFGANNFETEPQSAPKSNQTLSSVSSVSGLPPPPALPQRSNSQALSIDSVASPPSYSAVPPPIIPSRTNTGEPLKQSSKIASFQTTSVSSPKTTSVSPKHGGSQKKAPPPPVKPKNLSANLPPKPAPKPTTSTGKIIPQLDNITSTSFNPATPHAVNKSPSANTETTQTHSTFPHDLNTVNREVNNVTSVTTQLEKSSIDPSSVGRTASIRDKIQALNSTQPNFASQIAGRFNSNYSQADSTIIPPDISSPKPSSIKKPTPVLPPKQHSSNSNQNSSPPIPQPRKTPVQDHPSSLQTETDTPPPINYSTRPTGYQPSRPPVLNFKDFDLQLQTGWFASPVIKLPSSFSNTNHTYSTQFSGSSSTLILAIRISEDLSIVKYRLQWDSTNPLGTVKSERKELLPPPTLTQAQLVQAYEQFGNGVASWAEASIGRQVGNGECWTLAQEAIEKSSHGFAMSSQGYTHGAVVYHAIGGASAPLAYNDSIRRGDILQFKNGKFETRNSQGVVVSTSTVGMPDHTSVVTSVSENNRVVDILQQNVGGVKIVQKGQHNLDEFTEGEIKIFRPVWKEWAGDLEPSW